MKPVSYKRHHVPPNVIRHAVWLYFRFTLSLRDVEALLAERGIEVRAENSHLPICQRERKQQRFKSQGSAQRFLSTHDALYNTFLQPHLISRPGLRALRAGVHAVWTNAPGAT